MKNTYTIPASIREDVQKQVARIQKKAEKYGKALTVTYGENYAKEIPVRVHDAHEIKTLWTEWHEVFDLTVDSEIVQKDGYTVVAAIEHLDGGNIVSTFGCEVKPEWLHSDCRCEHCRTSRVRSKTFIVRGEDGTELQVGRTCLHDYCGINPQTIGYRNELDEILLDSDIDGWDFGAKPVQPVYDVMKVLAMAVSVHRKQGYIKSGEKGSNKEKIYEALKKREEPTAEDIAKAEAMAEIIKNTTDRDAIWFLLSDTKSLLNTEYCKVSHFGYLAYAPVAVEKYAEELKRRAEKDAEKAAQKKSEYVGEIGKRMVFDLSKMELVTSWETKFGMTHLYKFTTVDGNVLVWFGSSILGRWVKDRSGFEHWVAEENAKRIKATVKAHNEREGVKQTIITRCAVA